MAAAALAGARLALVPAALQQATYNLPATAALFRRPRHPSAGLAIVSEPTTAEQAAAKQEALHSRFGQVSACWKHGHTLCGLQPLPSLCVPCLWRAPPTAKKTSLPAPAPAPQVLRSKGFVWLAGRDDVSGDWSQAGSVLRIRCGGAAVA